MSFVSWRSSIHTTFLLAVLLLVLLMPGPRADATPASPTPAPGPKITVLVPRGSPASINVRSGPGTTYPVIGAAKKGQQYTVTGRDAQTQWWQVDFNGRQGWIFGSLVQANAAALAVEVVQNIAPPSQAAARSIASKSATAKLAATPIPPAGPPLPPYVDVITLDASTGYPVRGRSIAGWSYEFLDESTNYDVLINRDIFGLFLNQLWPDLLKLHPKGVRISFKDADPAVDYPKRYQWSGGFGDGESAYVVVHPCVTTHEEHNSIWQNELVTCDITLVSPGPGLTDIAITATALGPSKAISGANPVFTQAPFTHLGKATRDAESGQWRWADPFLTIVSLKPAPVVPATATGAVSAAKGPLPPATGHIAFTRTRDNNGPTPAGINDIAIVDVKTGQIRVLAQNGRQPDVRNDGRIVFNGEGGGRDDLQVVEADGSNLRPISIHPEDSAPSWSDGGSLAFHSAMAGGTDRIFVQWNGDQRGEPQYLEVDNGSNLRPFTGRYPVWVGDRIAYTGCDEWAKRSVCGLRIVDIGILMSTKGSGAVKLLTQVPEDRPTDVAGDAILFSSPRTGDWDIYVIPVSGGKVRNLTSSPSLDLGGTFSPDGNYIAFMSNRSGWGIWIMEADGANPRLLVAVPEGFGKLWDQDRLSWGP